MKRSCLPSRVRSALRKCCKKLLALTAADIAAVGPGVLTKWKESLLIELYCGRCRKCRAIVMQPGAPERWPNVADDVCRQVGVAGRKRRRARLGRGTIEAVPRRYVYGDGVARIAAHLTAVRRLTAAMCSSKQISTRDWGCASTAVITHNDLAPGIFSKITGVMAGKGLQILDAQILTREDGIVVDTFQVTDPDYQAPRRPNGRRLSASASRRC